MSDIEEPPTKVAKYEMSQTYTQPEEMDESHDDGNDEGQEEWLSEGLLTDDDTAFEGDSTNQLQDTTTDSQDVSTTQERNDKIDANIERTLNSMDNSQSSQNDDPFDELLKQGPNEKKEESDENDTDDLLRLLEDDGKSKKTKVMTKTKPKEKPRNDNASSDEEDGFMYQGTTVKKLRVAKNALIHRYPSKAMPETTDDDETDASFEDAETMKKMFATKKPANPPAKEAKPVPKQQAQPTKAFVPKKVVRIVNTSSVRQAPERRPQASSTPLPVTRKSILKRKEPPKPVKVSKPVEIVNKPEPKKPQPEPEEIIDEEEFLEEDDFELDEDFAVESDSELEKRQIKQRIMRPEQMDEEMLSDGDSISEDESMYDELPSSDSDDMDEWFTLDIRAERAGDYLPLLGQKAYDLLTEEKSRVSSRLNSLRESLSSLSAGSRQQSEKLKNATQALAEIDDMLKAH